MKILTVVCDLDKGGTQRAAQVFAEGYHQLRYDSRILSLYGLGIRYDEIKDEILVFDRLTKDNVELIKQWCPDTIHIHSHGPKEQDIALLLDAVLIVNPNLRVFETNVFSKVSAWADRVDYSFQLSTWCKWLYQQRGGRESNSPIVPYPVKTSGFSVSHKEQVDVFRYNYGIPKSAFVIGRIGQNFSGKWSYTTIRIFEELAKIYDFVYLIIVNPPQNIINQMESSVFRGRIIHIPLIKGDVALSIAYSSFDVLYLGVEQGESFGMVIAEAILCGTPVVALSTPWGDNSQGEVLEHNVGGVVVHTQKSATKIIDLMIKKEFQYNPEEGIKSIIRRYDYLKVSRMAIDYLDKDKSVKKVSVKNILDYLSCSYDKPKLLTKLLLIIGLRKFTVFSSGYYGMSSKKEFFLKLREKLGV